MNAKYTNFVHIIPILIFITVWLPELSHYYVQTAPISHEAIDKLKVVPSNAIMEELSELSLGVLPNLSDFQLIQLADNILEGKLSLPGYETIPVKLPFDPDDLRQGLPTWNLMFASLVAPEILIEAYNITQKTHYFDLAHKMILSWAEYEQKKWLPTGFLWNDHAIAARTTVLSKFWHIYRKRQDFNPDVAQKILKFVSRNGEMLAKKGHFTVATNHGILQNLALLHIATVFPALPSSSKFLQIAYERLQDQMPFFINEEGIVLEHSAGYHEHGVKLIGNILRHLTLNGITPPQSWFNKYEKSKQFLAEIRRPDGTLPLFGNTLSQSTYKELLTLSQKGLSESLYPVAGYSVWWRDYESGLSIYPYSQTILTWSYFPGHGHKLADEMSLLIWADGENWLTNTGYWPYGIPGRKKVSSWDGSNAPHLTGELKNSERKTQLLRYQVIDNLAFSHLRRTGPAGYQTERQVVHLDADLWIVIDYASDKVPQRTTTTTWTFSNTLNVIEGNLPGQIILSNPAQSCMSVFFLGSEKMQLKHYKGSNDPFAGWIVKELNQPLAAPSVMTVRSSENTWSLTVFSLAKNCREIFADYPKMLHWSGPALWSLLLPMQKGEIRIDRKDRSISVNNPTDKSANIQLTLQDVDKVPTEKNIISNAFKSAELKYKRYNQDLTYYRIKISYILLALFSIQIVFFILYKKMNLPFLNHLKILSNFFWMILGGYLFFVYFQT